MRQRWLDPRVPDPGIACRRTPGLGNENTQTKRSQETMNASSSQSHCLLPETEQKARRDTVLRDILVNALDVRELEDGISLRFPGNDAWFRKLADFVSIEQACCPFLA